MGTSPADTMLTIPAGRVTLSDRRTQRTWTVDVDAFELAAVPVTAHLYAGVTGEEGRLPATEVSWEDTVAFCIALSRQEGRTSAYRTDGDVAWYRGNSGERPHPVGSREPNAWGLHDVLGNVWEWCWDLYDPEVYGGYRVLRGGGWFDEHWSCRASVRRRSHPTLRLDDVGFRLARSLPR